MDNVTNKLEELFIRPLRFVTNAQLTAFCRKRTPCYEAYQSVADIGRKRDKRAVSKWFFAMAFAMGADWYRRTSTDKTKALADRMVLEAERQSAEMFHKARLDVLR